MQIKVHISMNLVGCERTETLEFDDADWEAMTDEDREAAVREWAFDHIEFWWEPATPEATGEPT